MLKRKPCVIPVVRDSGLVALPMGWWKQKINWTWFRLLVGLARNRGKYAMWYKQVQNTTNYDQWLHTSIFPHSVKHNMLLNWSRNLAQGRCQNTTLCQMLIAGATSGPAGRDVWLATTGSLQGRPPRWAARLLASARHPTQSPADSGVLPRIFRQGCLLVGPTLLFEECPKLRPGNEVPSSPS